MKRPIGTKYIGVWPLWIRLALLVPLGSCGTQPGEDVGRSDADMDTADTVDAAADATPVDVRWDPPVDCEGAPGFDCVQDCATDVSFPAVCVGSEWSCPPDRPIRFDECGPSCPGSPEPCCNESGAGAAQQECVLGAWSCAGGSSPDWCCSPGSDVCVAECDAGPTPMACDRGALACAEGTFDRTECGCGASPPACCLASGVPIDTLCSDSGWECPSDAANEFCTAGPDSLDGTWSELARLDCDGSESTSADPIAEFSVGGSEFELTYASGMFETFKNYWGTYRYSPETGRATFAIDGGNSNPTLAVLEGQVIDLDNGQAEWRGFWFGTNDDDPAPPDHCGYRMQR